MTRLEFVFSLVLIVVIVWLWNETAKYSGWTMHGAMPFLQLLGRFFLGH